MNTLIPLCLYRVRYEIATGRPYSEIERLVLSAVADGVTTLEQLQKEFLLPKSRILVESLVTLARAGWVAIDARSGGFKATQSGIEAATRRTMPPFAVIEAREATVFSERLTGFLVSNREMRSYLSRGDAERHPAWSNRERPQFTHHRIDPVKLREILPCKPEWRVRWIDNPVPVNTSLWLPVEVGAASGLVFNLPERWQRTLGSRLSQKMRSVPVEDEVKSIGKKDEDERTAFFQDFTENDLILTNREHHVALEAAFDDATDCICIASAFLSGKVLDAQIRGKILTALRRGVKVYLLWGYEKGEAAAAAVAWLKSLKRDASAAGANLMFNTRLSGSHAKLLIYNRRNEWKAWLGSCNWLSARLQIGPDDALLANASVCLRNCGVVALLVRQFLSLWALSRRGVTSEAPRELEIRAETIESIGMDASAVPAATNKIFLCRDQEHQDELRLLLQTARRDAIVISHKAESVGGGRMAAASVRNSDECRRLRVVYAESSSLENETALRDYVSGAGGETACLPHVHAKVVASDDRVLISSYNFLSADPFGRAQDAKELGLLIYSDILALKVRSAVDTITAAHKTQL